MSAERDLAARIVDLRRRRKTFAEIGQIVGERPATCQRLDAEYREAARVEVVAVKLPDLDTADVWATDEGDLIELFAGSEMSGPSRLDLDAAKGLRDWLDQWIGAR